jgi:hypothetical protein
LIVFALAGLSTMTRARLLRFGDGSAEASAFGFFFAALGATGSAASEAGAREELFLGAWVMSVAASEAGRSAGKGGP